ncbi:MAG: FHA domain-containing protein [Rhodanobacteraceae bacterium]
MLRAYPVETTGFTDEPRYSNRSPGRTGSAGLLYTGGCWSASDYCLMRLCFPNGEHADVLVDEGTASIGSADDNDIVVAGPNIAARHASISVDARGVVMNILDSAARTHVNARPVREKALLRLGDLLNLGAMAVLLKPDRDDSIERSLPPLDDGSQDQDAVPSRTVLRGMSGAYFGRTVTIDQRLVIGRGGECGLRIDEPSVALRHAAVETHSDSVHLRNLDSTAGTWVNGVLVRDAVLHSGDQLVFDQHRFLLEAPGMPLRGQMDTPAPRPSITQTMRAIDLDTTPAPASASRYGIWWLIGIAALIGLALATLLLREI